MQHFRWTRWYSLFFVALFSISLATCSSSNNGTDDGDAGNGDNDGDAGNGDDTPLKTLKWSARQEVDLERAGTQLAIAAMPDGNNFAIAYFKTLDEMGECSEPILGDTYTDVIQERVRYAWSDGDTWTHEDVDTVATVMITGISIVFDGSTPLIGYLGGTPLGGLQVCGGTDAVVASRNSPGNWSTPSAVSLSNEAAAGADCPKMQAICDFGDVVGLWTNLAKASDGTIGLIYRDIHNGYTKDADDAADLEYAQKAGGSWTNEWIDLARGGGDFPSLAFGPDNEPAVAYYNGEFGQIFFAKRPWADWTKPPNCDTNADCDLGQTCGSGDCVCATDSNCESPRRCIGDRCSVVIDSMDNGLPEGSVSLAVGPDGRFLVAYFDIDEKNLMLAHSMDGLTWTKSLVDSQDSTGMYPTIVIDPTTGQPGIAYYRCSDYSPNSLVCNKNQDGLLYAYFTGNYPDELSTQAKWKKSIVSEDSNAFDGLQASAAVLPDGRIGIAYHYTWFDPGSSTTQLNLMFRVGTWE